MSNSSWNPRGWLNMKTSLGADYINSETENTSATGTNLPPGAQTVGSAATKAATDVQPTAVKTLGLYVQEQAGIHDRLFLTVAVRTDQNSAFGTNFQRVFYPKAQSLVDDLGRELLPARQLPQLVPSPHGVRTVRRTARFARRVAHVRRDDGRTSRARRRPA